MSRVRELKGDDEEESPIVVENTGGGGGCESYYSKKTVMINETVQKKQPAHCQCNRTAFQLKLLRDFKSAIIK